MRQHILLGMLILTAGLAQASPISYTQTFNLQSGSPAPSGASFTYDAATSTFTNFRVTWDGVAFDLASSANNPVIALPELACLGGATGGAASFILVSGGCYHSGPGPSNTFGGFPSGPPGFARFQYNAQDGVSGITISGTAADSSGNAAFGQWSIPAAAATPEPSTWFLSSFALLSLFIALRRRTAKPPTPSRQH